MSELTIAYSRGKYTVTKTEGLHKTTWDFTAEEFSAELLRDILGMEDSRPLFLQPVAPAGEGENDWNAYFADARNRQAASMTQFPQKQHSREDDAAREAELALRNGGSALAQGLALDAPAIDDAQLKGMPLPGDYKRVEGLEEAWKAFKEASEEFGE